MLSGFPTPRVNDDLYKVENTPPFVSISTKVVLARRLHPLFSCDTRCANPSGVLSAVVLIPSYASSFRGVLLHECAQPPYGWSLENYDELSRRS